MNRFITTALMAGFLGAGSLTAIAAESSPASAPPCPPPAGAGYRQGPGPGPGAMRPGYYSMKQALGLSDKQDARLRDIRQAHFQEVAPLRQELFRLRKELAAESVSKHPDERKIAGLANQIGQGHARLAMLESRHLKQMSTVLNKKQMDTMLNMKQGRGFHKGGRNW